MKTNILKHIVAKVKKTKLGNYYSISLDYTAIFMPVPMSRANERPADKSITHMQQWRHHMTAHSL